VASPPSRSPHGAIYSIARDHVLPARASCAASTAAARPSARFAVTTVLACTGLLLGLHSAAVGSLIAFGTAAIYVAFLLVALAALAALVARLRGSRVPAGAVRMGRRTGVAINAAAVGWLGFETVNIAWPRASLAPPGAPTYQIWAAALLLAMIAIVGLTYLAGARPHRKPVSGARGLD
jgi:hypothetical protein